MSRFLVTGGAGFIGSHLSENLLAAGHRVRVLDDLSTGKRDNLPPGTDFIEGSICDPDTLAAAMAEVDGVFHLAAIASVHRCIEEWQASSAVNILGSIAVFEACAAASIPFVYASSAAVYGDIPPPADLSAKVRPLSAYGVDKYAMELHAAAGAVTRGTRSFGMRFFNIYGPRQDPASPYSGVIAIFMARIAAGLPVTIFGDGLQTRDFVYVGDAVRALMAGMNSLGADAAPRADVENVATGVQTDLLTLAATIGEIVGQSPDLSHAPARDGDIRFSGADPSGRLTQLGARAETPLKVGLSNLHASL